MTHTDKTVRKGTDLRKMVALMTSDEILSLDIQDALESVGMGTILGHNYEADGVPTHASAVIIDLKMTDLRSHMAVADLMARNVPVITISTDEHTTSTFRNMPRVVASFSKPLCVDTLLPCVIAVSKQERHA